METTQYVKLTSKGKVALNLVDTRLKSLFVVLLEKVMHGHEHSLSGHYRQVPLNLKTVDDKKNMALISEIYVRHFQAFNMNQPCKLLLTQSQALCLWQMSCEYEVEFYNDAQMSALLMQLHQKLS